MNLWKLRKLEKLGKLPNPPLLLSSPIVRDMVLLLGKN